MLRPHLRAVLFLVLADERWIPKKSHNEFYTNTHNNAHCLPEFGGNTEILAAPHQRIALAALGCRGQS